MARTRTTPTAKLTPKYGTSSGTNPAEDFEEPEDLSDVAGINAEIPRGSARPTGSLIQPKPKPRSPIGIEAGKSAGGGLGVVVSLPLGAGPISGRGGINLGAGGAIKGGSIGLGFGLGPIGGSIDVGTDQDEEGRGGCYQYVTVTAGPFSHTYGRNVCEPKPPPAPPPAPPAPPAPPPTPQTPDSPLPPVVQNTYVPPGDPVCTAIVGNKVTSWQYYNGVVWECGGQFIGDHLGTDVEGEGWIIGDIHPDDEAKLTTFDLLSMSPQWRLISQIIKQGKGTECSRLYYYRPQWDLQPFECRSGHRQTIINREGAVFSSFYSSGSSKVTLRRISANVISTSVNDSQPPNQVKVASIPMPDPDSLFLAYGKASDINAFFNAWNALENNRRKTGSSRGSGMCTYIGGSSYTRQYTVNRFVVPKANPFTPLSPPVPNPPPRKKMDDKCCKALMLMMLMQHKHLGVTPIPGMEQLKSAEVTAKGEKFYTEQMTFPFEVPKRWLDPTAKKEEKILVKNVSELLFIMGSQSERLERVIGTKEFVKDSEGKLRQSEGNLGSWLSGKNPDFAYPDPNDFWFNTDDGIINEKRLEVRSLTDAIRYVVEMGNRLERILPIAELKDSSIPKRWIYPGAKGQQRVGNLIHLLELMVRSDDKHRGYWPVKVKVKDADPAIKGDQPVELEFHSQADVFRELFQFLIDMEGDGDMSSNFALRSAFQTCQMHQLTVQNNAMLDAIVEYLDFKINKTKTSVPMPFNPFAGMSPEISDNILTALGIIEGAVMNPKIDSNKEADIEALAPNILQNSLVVVDIIECDESKTLNEALLELLKHSSAASAAVSERVSESAIDRVVEGAGLAQKITSFLLRRDVASALGIGDLDKWINSAELGYTDSPESQGLRFPESDPNEPYGRPITENPKIREIDTKEPKAD